LLVAGLVVRGRGPRARARLAARARAARSGDPQRRHVPDRELVGLEIRRQLRPSRVRRHAGAAGDFPGVVLRVGRGTPTTEGRRRRRRHLDGRAVGRADAAVLVRHFAGRQPHVAAIPRRVPAIPMTRTRVAILLLCAALAASAAAYLRNPPWIGEITSGLSPW